MLRRFASPWVLAVALSFLLGLYIGSVQHWRSGSAVVARSDTRDVSAKSSRSHVRAHSSSSSKRSASKKRVVVEEDDDDEPVEEEEEEVVPVKSSKKSSKSSKSGSKPAGRSAAAGMGLLSAADAPPKPDWGDPHEVRYYDGHTIKVYPHIDHGAGGVNWWPVVSGGWELDTLQAMKFFIELHKARVAGSGKASIQIDFGCWVAPTVLFAAHYADKVYALEPDPAAYREAHHNIELNPALSAKIDKRRICISNKAGELTMYGSPGDSMSSSFPGINPTQRKGYTQWNVNCVTLDSFIEAESIDTDEIALIKVDTEGHEAPIMWQMRDWFKAHPNIVVSLSVHAFLYPDGNNPEHRAMQDQLQAVIMDFKTVLFTHGEVVDKAAFTVGGWCRLCSLILTNMDLPAGYADWKAALSSA